MLTDATKIAAMENQVLLGLRASTAVQAALLELNDGSVDPEMSYRGLEKAIDELCAIDKVIKRILNR